MSLTRLKQQVLLYYYRTKFTVAEWVVLLFAAFWLTKITIPYIIQVLK